MITVDNRYKFIHVSVNIIPILFKIKLFMQLLNIETYKRNIIIIKSNNQLRNKCNKNRSI